MGITKIPLHLLINYLMLKEYKALPAPPVQLLLALLILLVLAGCAPVIRAEQPVQADSILLENGKTIGQTFTTHYQGLEGIAVYLKPENTGAGVVRLHLYSDSAETEGLAEASLAVQAVNRPGFYRFQFPTLMDATGKDYYFSLEVEGAGSLRVATGPPESYLNGALYQNQVPQEAQMTFRLAYSPGRVLPGLAREGLTWLVWLAAGAYLFIIPGWALLQLALPTWDRLHWAARLGLSGGLSLGLYPVLFLGANFLGLRLGPAFAWLLPVSGILGLAWQAIRKKKLLGEKVEVQPAKIPSEGRYSTWAAVLVIGLVFAVRLWAMRGLEAPMWGDSYQHAVIAQRMVEDGGLFETWEPYAPYYSLTVHYGFSAAAALLTWLTGIPAIQTTLLAGQLLNGLAVLALFPLAMRICRGNPWAGVGAVLIAGLLSHLPAIYVNWGRYAQLAGQAVLPVALWMVWEVVGDRGGSPSEGNRPLRAPGAWIMLLLNGFILTGMLLSYYRMAFYYAAFVLVWLLAWALPRWRRDYRRWLLALVKLGIIAVVAGLAFLPWYLQLAGGKLASVAEAGVTSGSPLALVEADFQTWQTLENYLPGFLLILSATAIGWAVNRKDWIVPGLALWVLVLTGYVAGQVIGLPGAHMLQSFSIIIALYIPVGLAVGYLTGEIAGWIITRGGHPNRMGLAVFAILTTLAVIGAWNQRHLSQPGEHAFVTRPDMRAMTWIRQNTQPEALFLVEAFRIYGGWSAVGTDAGWWLPLLAGRQNTMPPQYALLNEASIEPGYTQKVVDLVAGLETNPPGSPDGLRLLCEWNITHVYIGQGQGKTGAGAAQLFAPVNLADHPAFDLVYHQDRVYIYALDPQICEGSR